MARRVFLLADFDRRCRTQNNAHNKQQGDRVPCRPGRPVPSVVSTCRSIFLACTRRQHISSVARHKITARQTIILVCLYIWGWCFQIGLAYAYLPRTVPAWKHRCKKTFFFIYAWKLLSSVHNGVDAMHCYSQFCAPFISSNSKRSHVIGQHQCSFVETQCRCTVSEKN